MKTKYNKEELEILEAFEGNRLKHVVNEEQEMYNLFLASENTIKSLEEVSVKIPSKELNELKANAKEKGVSLDSLISFLVHSYLENKFAYKI